MYNSKPILSVLYHFLTMHISTFKRHSSFFSKSRFIIMDSALPWKRVTQMWEKFNPLSQLKVGFVTFFLLFFSFLWDRELFLLPEVRADLSYGSIFRESPSINYFWHTSTTLCPLTAPQGFRDASCPVHHLKRQLWDWNQRVWQGTCSHAAIRQIFGGLQRPEDIQELSSHPANSAWLVLCGKTSIASQRRDVAEVDFWPSSHVLRSMWPKESLQMIIPQMRKKAADVVPKGSDSINSTPSKILMWEPALHQTYSFRLKVTFHWLLYWRSFSWNCRCTLVLQQAPDNSQSKQQWEIKEWNRSKIPR